MAAFHDIRSAAIISRLAYRRHLRTLSTTARFNMPVNTPVPGAYQFFPLNTPQPGATLSPVRTYMGSSRIVAEDQLQEKYPQNHHIPPLFRPITLRGVTFPNRIFVVRLSAAIPRPRRSDNTPSRARCASTALTTGTRPTGISSISASSPTVVPVRSCWRRRQSFPKVRCAHSRIFAHV